MRFHHQPLVGHAFIVRRKDKKQINILRKKRVQGRNSKKNATTVAKKDIKPQIVGRKKKTKKQDPNDTRYQRKRLMQLWITTVEVGQWNFCCVK